MSIRLARRFRAPVAAVRGGLERQERMLFDLLCSAGELGYRLPDNDVNLRCVSGIRDPRKLLARDFSRMRRVNGPQAWACAGNRLVRFVADELARREGDEEYRALRVLLGYAQCALAPDCAVPRDPLFRVAWKTDLKLFAGLFPERIVRPLGRLECLDGRRLAILRREIAAGVRIGRRASGQRPGPEGRRFAVDPRLTALVGDALGRELSPGYQAKYLFYTSPGDHAWPHSDDPKYAVQALVCIDRELPPGRSTGSAFLAYRPDGSVERYELSPGSALAVTPGLVHGREPLRQGERIVLLSVGLSSPPRGAGETRARRRGSFRTIRDQSAGATVNAL